jgi:pimeloyl-ACP methyl ester carboxylesterase
MRKSLRRLAVGLAGLVGAAVFGLAVLGAIQKPDLTLPAGARGQHVTLSGTPIRYVQAGAGRDVLLVHGSPGSVEDWDPVFDRLAQRFRVTAFDRPGHGYSGGAELPHTPVENARLAIELVRALGLERVLFVGHSYGGATALQLATTDPPEIAAFVLVGARAYPPIHVDTIYRLVDVPVLGAGFAAIAARFTGPARVESGLRASFGPNLDSLPSGLALSRGALWTRPTVVVSLAEERTTLEAALTASRARYSTIRKPVFILCGDQDHPNFEQASRLAREIPQARFTPLENTGHMVQYARPAELIAAIDAAAAATN